MPITSPGNDDDTGENHQPTLRKNTAEPVEQTLKQNTQHDPTDYELEYGELRRPMFASPDENGTAVNAAEGAGGEQARIHSVEALHRLGRF